ncbi:MAG: DUF488 domain-containing protein [Candidatus Omnitrophota bacterium]|jgi:uncharacterized protein (DUF488 family)
MQIFTIGHGAKPVDEFISLLKTYKVQRIVDVRTIPRSRHNPQFNKEILPKSLKKVHIGYIHIKGLGGLRHAKKDSVNMAWKNASFRGFADYMQTEDFNKSVERLIKLAKQKKISIMCAESVPWRCHRSLIADALQVRGVQVKHIMSRKTCNDHNLTPWAKVKDFQVTYP